MMVTYEVRKRISLERLVGAMEAIDRLEDEGVHADHLIEGERQSHFDMYLDSLAQTREIHGGER